MNLTDSWMAPKNWTEEGLIKNHGAVEFKISHRERGTFKLNLKDFIQYSKLQHDETPLYVFDARFGEKSPQMLKDYS